MVGLLPERGHRRAIGGSQSGHRALLSFACEPGRRDGLENDYRTRLR